MSVGAIIRRELAADPAVAEICGEGVYLAAAPDGAARPLLVVSVAGDPRLDADGAPDAQGAALVQIAALADRWSDADELALAAAEAMEAARDVSDRDGPTDVPNMDPAGTIFARQLTYTVYHTLDDEET